MEGGGDRDALTVVLFLLKLILSRGLCPDT
jgi:hypothetical protein